MPVPPAHLPQVRILPEACMSVYCECCVLSDVAAKGRSLVQRCPTGCDVCVCLSVIVKCPAIEEKLSGIKIHVAWSQDSTLTSTWTHEQSPLTNGLNPTSMLDCKFNLVYKFIAIDIRKRRVAASCGPNILNDVWIVYYDCKV
jgi:hypothetical protein